MWVAPGGERCDGTVLAGRVLGPVRALSRHVYGDGVGGGAGQGVEDAGCRVDAGQPCGHRLGRAGGQECGRFATAVAFVDLRQQPGRQCRAAAQLEEAIGVVAYGPDVA